MLFVYQLVLHNIECKFRALHNIARLTTFVSIVYFKIIKNHAYCSFSLLCVA